MQYLIFRKPVLMEDEGREFYFGKVEAKSESDAKQLAAKQWGSNYFYSCDFRAIKE